jgi:hypothetical protein
MAVKKLLEGYTVDPREALEQMNALLGKRVIIFDREELGNFLCEGNLNNLARQGMERYILTPDEVREGFSLQIGPNEFAKRVEQKFHYTRI